MVQAILPTAEERPQFDMSLSPNRRTITGASDHSADTAEPPPRLAHRRNRRLSDRLDRGFESAQAGGAVGWVAYSPASYLNETRSFVRSVTPPSSATWMSCATTSATLTSRSVPLAAVMATDAASSQDCALVPMRSVTL